MFFSAILCEVRDNYLTTSLTISNPTFFVSNSAPTTEKIKIQSLSNSMNIKTCNKCGGNGYMKSSPNCYHTCLTCLGKGLISEERENIK